MSDKGYIKLNRKLFEHRLWCEAREFSTFEAWLDLIKSARFEDATQNIGKYQTQLIKRGQVIASMRFLSERWKWSTKKVSRFLQYLQSEGMISKETPKETGITTITLLNYDTYNQGGNTKETPVKTGGKQQGNSKETNISNYKELNKENIIPPISPKGEIGFDFSFVEQSFKQPFSEWLEYKASRKEKYKSQLSLKKCYNQLLAYASNDPTKAQAIVDRSMANGYQGIFELPTNYQAKVAEKSSQNPNQALPSGENYCEIPR